MQIAILKDVAHYRLPAIEYRSIISGSSRSDHIENCLTYCLNKMRQHLGIDLAMGALEFRPSSFVRNIINQQEQHPDRSMPRTP